MAELIFQYHYCIIQSFRNFWCKHFLLSLLITVVLLNLFLWKLGFFNGKKWEKIHDLQL